MQEKIMRKNLDRLTLDYIERVHQAIKDPDTDLNVINDCIRVFHHLGRMGLIPIPIPKDLVGPLVEP